MLLWQTVVKDRGGKRAKCPRLHQKRMCKVYKTLLYVLMSDSLILLIVTINVENVFFYSLNCSIFLCSLKCVSDK